MTFYGVLWAAGSADIIATQFHLRFEDVIWVFRVLIIAGPVIAAVLVRQGCLALLAHERERETHGVESGVIVRLPTGGYAEVVWTPAPALPPRSEHHGRSVDPGPEPEHGQCRRERWARTRRWPGPLAERLTAWSPRDVDSVA